MMNVVTIKAALIALVICLVAVGHAVAQSIKLSEPILINGDSNEDSKAALDLVAETAGEGKLIIMIARLGNGESSRRLSWRRLDTARSFLESVRAVPKQRMILAEGEVMRGQGRIEVYLDGKLYMINVFARNKDFASEG